MVVVVVVVVVGDTFSSVNASGHPSPRDTGVCAATSFGRRGFRAVLVRTKLFDLSTSASGQRSPASRSAATLTAGDIYNRDDCTL